MKRPITSSLQGAREQRSFSGLTVQAEAQFDPLAAASAGGALQTAQSSQRVAQLQNDILATALQQKAKDLEDRKLKYSDVLGTNPVSAPTPSGTAPVFPATNAASALGTPFTNTFPGLPSASNIVFVPSDKIQLTAQEQFRDRLAYRDAVSAIMREKELDDT